MQAANRVERRPQTAVAKVIRGIPTKQDEWPGCVQVAPEPLELLRRGELTVFREQIDHLPVDANGASRRGERFDQLANGRLESLAIGPSAPQKLRQRRRGVEYVQLRLLRQLHDRAAALRQIS